MKILMPCYRLWLAAGLLTLLSVMNTFAEKPVQPGSVIAADSALSIEIRRQVQTNENSSKLNFPASVTRFYIRSNYRPLWIKAQNGTGPAWQAMLAIDCVLQYGLNRNNYHPQDLTYTRLHDILDTPGKLSPQIQARYEILLTDAILSLINNLHYGKLNPDYAAARIDSDLNPKFSAVTILATWQSNTDLLPVIDGVQPKARLYTQLQRRMHLLEGVYQDDCYDVPQAEVRKIAINMERLRWAETDDSVYTQINIPSYTLQLFLKDTVRQFKVIVGKPSTPTPTLNSQLKYFTTAPEWKVPAKIFRNEILRIALADTAFLENNHYAIYNAKGLYIEPTRANLLLIKKDAHGYFARQSAGCDNALGVVVFRFPNRYDVYLHDTPEQGLFGRADRAFSHGCIRIENPAEFAQLLLRNDGATNKIPAMQQGIQNYITRNFYLKKPMPIKITYLTCGINEWGLVTYPDIYKLDKPLEMAMYGLAEQLTKE